ncbi:hypothetical protein [Kiloniella antarctica]|uniref:Uncharacterized protein n=1 Tax=Kiloniella antarctica TaxID=1550907 RepID=A0ABW5BH56_9PROT
MLIDIRHDLGLILTRWIVRRARSSGTRGYILLVQYSFNGVVSRGIKNIPHRTDVYFFVLDWAPTSIFIEAGVIPKRLIETFIFDKALLYFLSALS